MTFCGLTREFFDLCKQQSDNVIVNNALSEQMTKLNGTMFSRIWTATTLSLITLITQLLAAVVLLNCVSC